MTATEVARKPLRLRIINDFEIVVEGLRAMLMPFSHRICVVEAAVKDPGEEPVDLTLFDTFGAERTDTQALNEAVAAPGAGKVVVFSWDTDPGLVESVRAAGCQGYLHKSVSAAQLVEQLEQIYSGEETVLETVDFSSESAEVQLEHVGTYAAVWPGQSAGLSEREAEVISLIAQGYTNPEIAGRMYITVNSLKTYIRSAYRKIGVERRAQAVRWGIEHNMLPPAKS